MAVKVNPPPMNQMPTDFLKDREKRAYFQFIENILWQLYRRTGGATDIISGDTTNNSFSFSAPFIRSNEPYVHSVSADYTTIGNEVIEVTAACTITLNSSPDDGEVAIIEHNAGTDLVYVTDGTSTDTLSYSGVKIPYIYYLELGRWVP